MSKQKLTDEEIESILGNTAGSLAIEGLKPTKNTINVTRELLKGNISEAEAMVQIKDEIMATIKNDEQKNVIYPIAEERICDPEYRLDGENAYPYNR